MSRANKLRVYDPDSKLLTVILLPRCYKKAEHDDGLHKLLLLKGLKGVEHLHWGFQGLAGGRGCQRNQLLQGFGGVAGGIVPQ